MIGFVLVSFLIYLPSGIIGQSPDDEIINIFDLLGNGTTEATTTATTVVGVKDENPPPSRSKNCKCVRYCLCNGNNSIITDRIGLSDMIYLEVCCNLLSPGPSLTPPIQPTREPIKECGYKNPGGLLLRIGTDQDDEAQFGEFPWMVAVLAEEFNSGTDSTLNVYKCGGALIHPQAVVTAAHCVSARDKKFKIRAEEWDIQTAKELIPHQERYVQKIVIHSKYYVGGLLNDIAILFLDSPVTLTESANVLCLPEQDVVIPSGTRCFASGWGKDVFGKERKHQVILKKVDLPIVNRSTCQNQLRTTRLGKDFELNESFVCAGGERGKDTCKGDGGSPLACPIPGHRDRYQHVGMVAWGIECGEEQVPGVYVNVAMFRQWIDEQMTAQNLDKSTYQY